MKTKPRHLTGTCPRTNPNPETENIYLVSNHSKKVTHPYQNDTQEPKIYPHPNPHRLQLNRALLRATNIYLLYACGRTCYLCLS